MIRKTGLILILFFWNFLICFAQLDSLKTELASSTSDSSSFKLLLAIGQQHAELDSSTRYWNQAAIIAQNMGWLEGQAQVYKSKAVLQYRNNQMDSAIYYWRIALDFYNQEKEESGSVETEKKAAEISYYLSIPHFQLGNYLETIFYAKMALDAYLKLGIDRRVLSCYNMISLANFEQDNVVEAEKYAYQSFQMALEMKDSISIGVASNTLASIYLETDQYEKAIEGFRTALAYEGSKGLGQIQQLKMNIGQTYTHMQMYDSAQKLLEEGVEYFKSSSDEMSYITSLNLLSDLYEAQGRWKKIIPLGQKSLELTEDLPLLKQKREASENLYLAYENMEQTAMAYKYFKAYSAFRDSLYNKEKGKEIERLRAQLEYEEQNRAIGELTEENLTQALQLEQERNTRNLILSSASFILLLGGFLWLMYKRKQDKKQHALDMKRVEIEQRMLRSQMNPHFIFNALNSIQSYVTTNQTYEAEVFLSKFSLLVRKILENSAHKLISLEEETETLQLYLELEKVRFQDKFDFAIQFDEADQTLPIPPMLLQPFVENAILHGMKGKEGKGQIDVRFMEQKDVLICEVEDNGVGRSLNGKKAGDHRSMATGLTDDRINFFNKEIKGTGFSLLIFDLKHQDGSPSGTKVQLTIPIEA
ncbi:MAG: histidine kinase [Reichenbachiella sp.]|uniref:histidine kinase n=1 Tax=Reichenbachiella sp. TaxID=2184521 RepID=UPI0032980B65